LEGGAAWAAAGSNNSAAAAVSRVLMATAPTSAPEDLLRGWDRQAARC
jgi:hypothetical protein